MATKPWGLYFLAGFILAVIIMIYFPGVSNVISNRFQIDNEELQPPFQSNRPHYNHSHRQEDLKYKRDLPVVYLSDADTSENREKLLSGRGNNRTMPRTVAVSDGKILSRMIRMKMRDDYRLCVKIAPFVGPFPYTPKSKSPCWQTKAGRLACVPYFYLAGFSKSGTTDLFGRISAHPQIVSDDKEQHWLDFTRYYKNKDSIDFYASSFAKVSKTIADRIKTDGRSDLVLDSIDFYASSFAKVSKTIADRIKTYGHSDLVLGDGTPCYAWDSMYWPCYEGNRGLTQPRYTNADVIYRLNPDAKIILLLRDPVTRVYSRYLTHINKIDGPEFTDPSPYQFHKLMSRAVDLYTDCFKDWSLRHCAYNGTLLAMSKSRLTEGIYSIYIRDWLKVFPRAQILILKFEDYVVNVPEYLHKIYRFLNVAPLGNADVQNISRMKARNKGRHYDIGPIMNETKVLLQKFYAPFNQDLQALLDDTSWAWGYE